MNCIDKDCTNSGFDIELINAVRSAVPIPVIASSGAGCAEHFLEVFTKTKTEAPLAAGIFHRKEVPIGAVKEFLKDKVDDKIGVVTGRHGVRKEHLASNGQVLFYGL